MIKDNKNNLLGNGIIEPPADLYDKIIQRINKEQRISLIKKRMAIVSTVMIFSIAIAVPSFRMLQSDLYKSGFLQFFSLLFSDAGIISVYWQSFVMSLLETIPAFSMAIMLGILCAFGISLKYWLRDVRYYIKAKQLILV